MKKLMMLLCALTIIFVSCEKNDDPETQSTACFTYDSPTANSPLSYEIQFYNCSKDATSYLWDFGDGTTSAETEPKHTFEDAMFFVVKLTAYNGNLSNTLTDTIKNWQIAYKPNIYLYPEKTLDLCVSLDFPLGGKIIESIPEYNEQWCITVEPTGEINGRYDYLFYESIQPNVWQKEKGWSIAKEELTQFFTDNMNAFGFNSNEKNDFLAYWIPLLNESSYYNIYPQQAELINSVIELNLTEQANNINRLFYVIEKATHKTTLEKPEIISFNKEGFYVNEWGVILK